MNFLHTFVPSPVALHLGGIDVYWYGLIIAGAVVLGFSLTLRLFARRGIHSDHAYVLLLWLIIAGVFGGRIGHVLGDWDYYFSQPAELFQIWHGGLAIHGVLVAGFITVFIYARVKRLAFLALTDCLVVAVSFMQIFGRWGNYFNQELFGRPTTVAWGIPIEFANRPVGYEQYQYFYPTFLYESLLMIAVFAVLYWLFAKRQLPAGRMTVLYLVLFSVVRFSVDAFKIDLPMFGPLLVTQWISLLVIAGGVVLWLLFRRKALGQPSS